MDELRAELMRLAYGSLLLSVLACAQPDAQAEHVRQVIATGGVVDSAIPLAQRLERFRSTVQDRPDTLRHASPSLNHLVYRWAKAIEERDTSALNTMVLDRAEFAWLFYPDTRLARPPYEMPPAALWEQMLANSNEGVRKALDQLAGSPLRVRSARCLLPPEKEGANVLRQQCVVQLRSGSESVAEARWFGTVIERHGRFKFVGLSTGQ